MIVLVATALAADSDDFGPCVDLGVAYDDVTEASGVRAYARGLGVNLNDLDGDGDLDLYVATGPSTAEGGAYYPGVDVAYLNRGDLTFVESGGVMGLGDPCEDRAPLFGDLDNDGIPDLYVTVNGENLLYRGLGGGRYRDVSFEAGAAAHPGWGHQGFLFDYDGDGFLDVFFTNGPEDGSGFNTLLRNQRDGTFRDATWDAGVAGDPSGKGTCVLDVDRDGRLDIFVATGREFGNHLFVNQGDGTFADEAFERGLSDPTRRFGVGATCGDLDEDGDEDILLITHDRVFGGNELFENRDGEFVDVADIAGIGPFKDGHGSALIDVDLDGWLDIVLSGIRTPPFVFRNEGGMQFRRVCSGWGIAQEDGLTWAVAGGDLTGDGYPEVYISNGLGRRPADGHLYRHRGGDAHFVTVEAVGTLGNPSAVGAIVEATVGGRTITRRVGGWSSFDSQGPLPVTIGLGDSTVIDALRVTFTSGQTAELVGVATDQSLIVEEPGGQRDADHDGVPDVWDACAGTRAAFRTDFEGCSADQHGSFELTQVEPAQDAVLVDPVVFRWSGSAVSAVVQISLDGTFGPADRLDFGPIAASEYRLGDADWRALLALSDGTRPFLWRVAAIDDRGQQAITGARRLIVAVPDALVRIPLGANIFRPAHVVVPAGTTVTWWNDSVSAGNLQNEPHDVQLVDPVGRPASQMDELNGAGVFTWTFDSPGTWSYICHRHSGDGLITDQISEAVTHLHAPGPYRCMAGTVTVR